MNCLTLCEARQFAQWVEGRLLTEGEWFHLAHKADQGPFPWGELDVSCERAHYQGCSPAHTQTVCRLPEGFSLQVGLCDMLGNVEEWTIEQYQIEWPFFTADASPLYPVEMCSEQVSGVTRGGSWRTEGTQLSSALRSGFPTTTRSPMIGFRVAKSVD